MNYDMSKPGWLKAVAPHVDAKEAFTLTLPLSPYASAAREALLKALPFDLPLGDELGARLAPALDAVGKMKFASSVHLGFTEAFSLPALVKKAQKLGYRAKAGEKAELIFEVTFEVAVTAVV